MPRLIPRALTGIRLDGYWWGDEGGPIWLACPQCGTVYRVSAPRDGDEGGHDIDVAGNVSPSLACQTEGCGWHETVKLDGYGEDVLR